MTIVTTKPAALDLDSASAYLSLSPALFKQQAQHDSGFPKPVQLSSRRVGWLTAELDAWLAKRPRSTQLPVKNCGHGRRGKPADDSSKSASLPSQTSFSAS